MLRDRIEVFGSGLLSRVYSWKPLGCAGNDNPDLTWLGQPMALGETEFSTCATTCVIECRYEKQDWEECDPNTGQQRRVLKLKSSRSVATNCESEKYIHRVCKKSRSIVTSIAPDSHLKNCSVMSHCIELITRALHRDLPSYRTD